MPSSEPTSPAAFRAARQRGNERVLATEHLGLKRFFNLDAAAYRDAVDKGGLDSRTKELLGLVASLVLRCDDCVSFHLERCVAEGWSEKEIEEALFVGLVVGGSIVIPHLRRARLFLDALLAEERSAQR